MSRAVAFMSSGGDRPRNGAVRKGDCRPRLKPRRAHRRTYGPERRQHDLAALGVRVGAHRIQRIRRQLGLRCPQKRTAHEYKLLKIIKYHNLYRLAIARFDKT